MSTGLRMALALGSLVLLSACAAVAADSDREEMSGDAAMREVLRLIGEAPCKTDADCRTIAIGTKACGGPQRYLAWSVARTDAPALAAAAQTMADRQAAERAKPGALLSNCAFVADPGASCAAVEGAARQCVLQSRRGGSVGNNAR